MAYIFDGTDDYLIAATSALGSAVTAFPAAISVWYKDSAIADNKCIVNWGVSSSNSNGSIFAQTSVTASSKYGKGLWRSVGSTFYPTNTSGTEGSTFEACTYPSAMSESVWNLLVVTVNRNGTPYGTVQSFLWNSVLGSVTTGPLYTASTDFTDPTLDNLQICGSFANGTNYFSGYAAHVALWDRALNATDVAALATTAPNAVSFASNCKFYFTLAETNGIKDAIGGSITLNVNGAPAYDAAAGDPYSSGASAVAKIKLMTHPSAASAANVEGWVLNADLDTVLGHFSGKAFETSTESGQAVLKVSQGAFGVSTLTSGDTIYAVAQNSLFTTGLISGTVIEEE